MILDQALRRRTPRMQTESTTVPRGTIVNLPAFIFVMLISPPFQMWCFRLGEPSILDTTLEWGDQSIVLENALII